MRISTKELAAFSRHCTALFYSCSSNSLSEDGLGSDLCDFLPFTRLLNPPPSTCSVVDVERYKPPTFFALSGSLCLIGVVDVANELFACFGIYAAFRGFFPRLTSVELGEPQSSSSSGLLLVMQPDNARFHHGFLFEGAERTDCADRSVHDLCRVFIGWLGQIWVV